MRLFWKITRLKKSRVRAIIINRDKTKILLVKNISYSKFHLPGGGIEKGEDELTALHREIEEELGITMVPLYKLGKYKYQGTQNYVHIFVAQTKDENITMQWELDAAEWFEVQSLPKLKNSTKECLRDYIAHNEPVSGVWGLDD